MSPTKANLLCDDVTFSEVVERLHAARHTGAVTIHFAQGHAVRLELPCEPVRIRIDNRKKRAQS